MSIHLSCPECGTEYAAREASAGEQALCRQCGRLLTVPSASGAASNTPRPIKTKTTAATGDHAASADSASWQVVEEETTTGTAALECNWPIICPGCKASLPAGTKACANCGRFLAVRMRGAAPVATGFKNPQVLITAITLGGLLFFVLVYLIIHAIVLAPERTASSDAASPVAEGTSANPSGGDSPKADSSASNPDAATETTALSPPAAGSSPQVIYPPLPSPTQSGNHEAYGITLTGTGPAFPMRLSLFLPSGLTTPHSLPCVFVAPAGSRLFHGMPLDAGDFAEQIPYAEAGFAVCGYELSGAVPETGHLTFRDVAEPARMFAAADGGMANAEVAIGYVLAQVPEVDPNRLYAAGHSSAATVALDLAATDHRIKGVAVYAPCTDIETRLGSNLSTLERIIPGETAFLSRMSPINRVKDFACPVFLFHADDDTNVSLSDNQRFADAMTQAGRLIRFQRVPTGGHYHSMIDQGIGDGIAFFKSIGANPLPSQSATLPPQVATPAVSSDHFRFDVCNQSGHLVTNVKLGFGGNAGSYALGGIGADRDAGEATIPASLPDSADISWTNSHGVTRNQHLLITQPPADAAISPPGSGTPSIYFILDPDGTASVSYHDPRATH